MIRALLDRRAGFPRHRTTTAHLCSAYPFIAEQGLPKEGVYVGRNLLTGDDAFWYDPFSAYQHGLVTNPNMLFAGEPGTGKSATAKALIARSVSELGRWVAIADPKGEYRPLAEALGLQVLSLHPGGVNRLNPLDVVATTPAEASRQRAEMLQALSTSLLRRALTPLEDAALSWACSELVGNPTLADVCALLSHPTEAMSQRSLMSPVELGRAVESVRYALDRLLDGSLQGMFDGESSVSIDWSSRGVVIDLSSVHLNDDALAAVMIATNAWLQSVIATPAGPPKLQVLDEAWSLLSSERTTRYLQACWKLGRSYGVANLAIVHRLSDLRAQSDDGSAATKVAMGLLADTQTRVLFRQASDQLDDARTLLGLNAKEAELLGRLCKGRAIWKVGPHTAVVEHHLSDVETRIFNTDDRMNAR